MGSERRFRAQPHRRAMGAVGEDEAERYLGAQGYRIVARNFTCRGGEIDRVAWDGDTLCFVEIKARAGARFGSAIESISRAKRRRIVHAARRYLMASPTDQPCRFDVLAMDLETAGADRGSDAGVAWRFHLVRDAFEVDG